MIELFNGFMERTGQDGSPMTLKETTLSIEISKNFADIRLLVFILLIILRIDWL